jgi:predicted DCC family thiol-disulfide oxidoreductase YuxK
MNTDISNSFAFTMFYDGDCPLCSREVALLMKRDVHKRIRFISTASPDFDPVQYGISTDPNRLIHGMMADGTIVRGVEVFRQVYKQLGLGWLLAPTAWPGLKQMFDLLYLVFAKYRIPIGKIFGRKCANGSCEMDG